MGCDPCNIREVFYSLYPHDITNDVETVVDKIIIEGEDSRDVL
jgi:hypothetical protein